MKSMLERAATLDAADPTSAMRDAFHLPKGIIYLDGNSLGAMPNAARAVMAKAIETEWAEDLITSWNKAGWWDLPMRLGDKIGALIGAEAGSVVVTDSVSVNLYKLIGTAFSLRPGRNVLVTEAGGFHTDLYISEGAQGLTAGFERRLIRSLDELPAALDDKVALVLLSDVNYRTGTITDMKAVTGMIQASGALALWDLCHSAGVLPLALDDCRVDLAVGCTYKYLNGGPGAPAFLQVAKRHHAKARQPLTGWWGHAAPFAFEPQFRPDQGIRRFLTGTQPVLSMRALEASLDVALAADMRAVRAKSMSLTDFFIECTAATCAKHGMTLASPRQAALRGSQVSLVHPEGYAIIQAMIANGVIGDFRAPDILRFGFAPLYLSHRDVAEAALILDRIMATGHWRDPKFARRAAVT
jgi:kynureninase